MEFRFGALGCACLLFLGFWLFGCGAAEDAIDTIEVNEMEFSLDPADITLNQPGTYVFRANNVGNVVHSLAIEGQGIEEETPNIQPGESSQLKVNLDPGAYKLYCPVGNHEQRGQVGMVMVRAS